MQSWRETATKALSAGSPLAFWDLLEPHFSETKTDRELALAWCEWLAASPRSKDPAAQLNQLASTWSEDVELILGVAQAYVSWLERRPFDERSLGEGTDSFGSTVITKITKARPSLDRETSARSLRLEAQIKRLSLDHAGALAVLTPLMAHGDINAAYDVGVVNKEIRQHAAALEAFEKVTEGPLRRPALMNRALLSVCMGQDTSALYKELDINLHAFGNPVLAVRVPARDQVGSVRFELLSVKMETPFSGRVTSAVRGDSVADLGDLIAVEPYALFNSNELTVHPLYQVLQKASPEPVPFIMMMHDEVSLDQFTLGLADAGFDVHVFSKEAVSICPRCAAGDSFIKHEHGAVETHRYAEGKALSVSQISDAEVLRCWEGVKKHHPQVTVAAPKVYERVGDTKAAGKQHQLWGSIERGRGLKQPASN